MSTYTYTVSAPQVQNQSQFATWLQAFTTAMTTVGMVQTSDTGQISLTAPPTTNNNDTILGYQMYRFNDSLQSTAPLFIKISHGQSSQYGPGIWINLGTGSNGSGTLTGPQFAGYGQELGSYQNTTNNYSPAHCYFSGSSNRLQFSLLDDPSVNAGVIYFASIERTHDASGNDTSEGALLFAHSDRNWPTQGVLPFSSSIVTPPLQFGWQAPTSRINSMVNGSTIGVISPIPFGWRAYNPPIGVLIYAGSDIAQYSQNSLSVYGTAHNYQACGRSGYVVPRQEQGYNNGNTPTDYTGGTHILMRFE